MTSFTPPAERPDKSYMTAYERPQRLAPSRQCESTRLHCRKSLGSTVSTANRCTNTPSMPYSLSHSKWRSTVLRLVEEKTLAARPSTCRNEVSNFSSASSSLTSGHRSMLHDPG